jgi:hypothetical protein
MGFNRSHSRKSRDELELIEIELIAKRGAGCMNFLDGAGLRQRLDQLMTDRGFHWNPSMGNKLFPRFTFKDASRNKNGL